MKEARTWTRYSYLFLSDIPLASIVFETCSSNVCPDVVGTFRDGAGERGLLQCLQYNFLLFAYRPGGPIIREWEIQSGYARLLRGVGAQTVRKSWTF